MTIGSGSGSVGDNWGGTMPALRQEHKARKDFATSLTCMGLPLTLGEPIQVRGAGGSFNMSLGTLVSLPDH